MLRLHEPQLGAVDAYADDQQEATSRPEAIRHILTKFLRSKGYLPK